MLHLFKVNILADAAHRPFTPLRRLRYVLWIFEKKKASFDFSPFIKANHEECDRRCQELEEEIEILKRERTRLRQQSSSVQDLVR